VTLLLTAAAGGPVTPAPRETQAGDGPSAATHEWRWRGVLLEVSAIDGTRLETVRRAGFNAVVLALGDAGGEAEAKRQSEAAAQVRAADLELHYWIEIARHPRLADAHPAWMASLQGHDEWRRLFPKAPRPAAGGVIKAYPWVPILYEEAFAAHLARVRQILGRMPAADGVFLNDLQGAPSACGCGNTLCRWTADYGPVVTATPAAAGAAARFLAAARKLARNAEVVPVWTTECGEEDGTASGACAGVSCYEGRCWREFAAQLAPVRRESTRLGVLLPFKAFERDRPPHPAGAGWVKRALEALRARGAPEGEPAVRPQSLVPVLQGWDTTEAEVAAQIARVREYGADAYLVSRVKIDPSWRPRLLEQH
jgi:hypothetical protein